MSDYHRHNPEFSETIDLMFGVHVARPNEAVIDGPDDDFDMEQFESDIDLLSRAAFVPAPQVLLELLERIVVDRYHRTNLTQHLDEAERVVAAWKPLQQLPTEDV